MILKDRFIDHNPKYFIDSLILKEAKKITNIKVYHQERFEGKVIMMFYSFYGLI